MDLNRTLNPLLVETVKGDDHFLIRGRNTPAGRLAPSEPCGSGCWIAN